MATRKLPIRIIDKPYKIILTCFMLTFLGLFLAWGSVKIFIKTGANKIASQAVMQYQKNKTESLLMLILDDKTSIKQKNMAIWSLGTLKDENALTGLQKIDSLMLGKKNTGISEYELNRAILKIQGDWRGGLKVSQNQEE
ncbi:MAG: hypothetical protein ACOCZL_05410 [Bacteroidota bacterium]